MRLGFTDERSVGSESDRWRALPPLSLLLFGIGYALLIAAPSLSTRVLALPQAGSGLAESGPIIPAPAAAGLALLGGAAMVLVLAQLVRGVEARPYASIAPVLAVFSGFLLTGVRAKLPLEGFASEQIGVFALAPSLMGGALICRSNLAARALGWLLALLPAAVLALVLAPHAQLKDFLAALGGLEPQVRVFLALLGMSSLALAFVGSFSRMLSRSSPYGFEGASSSPDLTPRLPRVGGLFDSSDPMRSQTGLGPRRGGLSAVFLLGSAIVGAALLGAYWLVVRSGGQPAALSSAEAPELKVNPTVTPLGEGATSAAAPASGDARVEGAGSSKRRSSSAKAERVRSSEAHGKEHAAAKAASDDAQPDDKASQDKHGSRSASERHESDGKSGSGHRSDGKARSERHGSDGKSRSERHGSDGKSRMPQWGGASGDKSAAAAKPGDERARPDAKSTSAERAAARPSGGEESAKPSGEKPQVGKAGGEGAALAGKPQAKDGASDRPARRPASESPDDLVRAIDQVSGSPAARKPAAPKSQKDQELDDLLDKAVKGSKK